MDIVICPGCGEDVPHDNNGCPHCGYENNEDGRLLTLGELLEMPSYPQGGALRLNDVSAEFLRRLVAEARKTPNDLGNRRAAFGASVLTDELYVLDHGAK